MKRPFGFRVLITPKIVIGHLQLYLQRSMHLQVPVHIGKTIVVTIVVTRWTFLVFRRLAESRGVPKTAVYVARPAEYVLPRFDLILLEGSGDEVSTVISMQNGL